MKELDSDIVAHRGGCGENPENTLEAFREASKSEIVDSIELDVRETSDEIPVVFHDRNLSSKTDIEGKVSETPYDELKLARVLSSDQNIPKLEEVFDTVKKETSLILELKEDHLGEKIAKIAQEKPHDVTICSSNSEALTGLEKYDISTGYIIEERYMNRPFRVLPNDLPEWMYFPQKTMPQVLEAKEMDCDVIYPRVEMALRTNIIDQAEEENLDVSVWTVRNEKEYYEIFDYEGIDEIITDKYHFLE